MRPVCWLGVFAVGIILAWALPAGAASTSARTLRVTTTTDELAPHDKKCSLREAIQAVDSPGKATDCGTAARGSNRILLRARHYKLSIARSGGDDNASGDLNITGTVPLTVTGTGGATVIDGAGLGDRVLSVARGAKVTLTHLTITGGHAPAGKRGPAGTANVSCSGGGSGGGGNAAGSAGSGGGIYNAGALTLRAVGVTGNTAGTGGAGGAGGAQNATNACGGGSGGQGGSGGGIYNVGRLTVSGSAVRANKAGAGGAGGAGGSSSAGAGGPGGNGGAGGLGGGIYNRGKLSVTGSIIYRNRAGAGRDGGAGGSGSSGRGVDGSGGLGSAGGGIFSTHGTLQVTNSTLAGNVGGAGGAGGGLLSDGGAGGNGGAIDVTTGASTVLNATVAGNGVGAGGAGGSSGGSPGVRGSGGGLFVLSPRPADDLRLENTIVASNSGSDCAGNSGSAIANGGHNLSYGDGSCPGSNGNPRLSSLKNNGGPTATMALGSGSPAIDKVPATGAHCPATDQRGVHRPQGKGCDVGAFEFAVPRITITAPRGGGSYLRGSRVVARFRCSEGGIASPIAACRASVPAGRPINTSSTGTKRFTVTAVDKTGRKVKKTVRYTVWAYVNPLRAVGSLSSGRIDMGVDYVGSGPLLALGNGRVTFASNSDFGPPSCYGRTCWPGGGVVVYRLSDGPFAGKFVYDAENITVDVRAGETVRVGQRIAILHYGSPFMETGWASGKGPETLAIARGHQCTCGDPGGWSSIEGRNFDQLLVFLGAPSGYLQPNPPNQSMPPGWPKLPHHAGTLSMPTSRSPLSEGEAAGP
jgi:CSLREA domain-containing protein